MSQQGDHPIIPGIQSLSDAALLVAAESTRSVATHVELETRSEQELIQEAITNVVPPAVAVELVDVSLIPVQEIVAGEENIVTGEPSVTKDDEQTISKVSVQPFALPKAQGAVTSGTKDEVETIVKEPVQQSPLPKATGAVIGETTTGTKDDEETISKGSVQESPLPKFKGAATGEIRDTKDDAETSFKPPAEQSPLRKAEGAVAFESDEKTSTMEPAEPSSSPTAKGRKKKLQIQLQKPRKKVELPSHKKGAIAQANATAIQDAVSKKTRSSVKGNISSRTRQSSTHTAPLPEKKRLPYRKQKRSPSKALVANKPEEGPLSKKAKRSPSKAKQKVSPATCSSPV
jgi:hypothetical protein